MARNRFDRRGAFPCAVCGRRTRSVGESTDLCAECHELAGDDNMHNDNGTVPDDAERARYVELLARITAKGGDAERARAVNPFLFGLV